MENTQEQTQPVNGSPVVPTETPAPAKAAQITAVDLTPEEVGLLREIQAQVDALNNQGQGALRLMLKQRKLEGGPWDCDLASGRLVKKVQV